MKSKVNRFAVTSDCDTEIGIACRALIEAPTSAAEGSRSASPGLPGRNACPAP